MLAMCWKKQRGPYTGTISTLKHFAEDLVNTYLYPVLCSYAVAGAKYVKCPATYWPCKHFNAMAVT
jgi:hypothetical protein